MSQNKILFIFCAACFAGYFIAYIKKDRQHFSFLSCEVLPALDLFTFLTFSVLQEILLPELELIH